VLVVGNVNAVAAVADVAATLVNVVAIACPRLNLRKHTTIPYTTAIIAINTKPVTNVSECVAWLVCIYLFSSTEVNSNSLNLKKPVFGNIYLLYFLYVIAYILHV
jgi:hypothetical protein